MIVLLVSLGLVLFAAPAIWWGFTAPRRERKPNLIRLGIAAALSLGTFIPVLSTVLSLTR
jgi:hypothetical protein